MNLYYIFLLHKIKKKKLNTGSILVAKRNKHFNIMLVLLMIQRFDTKDFDKLLLLCRAKYCKLNNVEYTVFLLPVSKILLQQNDFIVKKKLNVFILHRVGE